MQAKQTESSTIGPPTRNPPCPRLYTNADRLYLADRIGLPVLQKRASDLLSKWVGGSEKAIAAAFAQARTEGALLLIDEAEALLFDRGAAARAFEVSQVDEMLTWMEQHLLPFVCTTNMVDRMDAAVPRRFTLKLRFEALDPARAALAFRRLLGAVPPGALPDGLTPGDFALVRRKPSCWANRARLCLRRGWTRNWRPRLERGTQSASGQRRRKPHPS